MQGFPDRLHGYFDDDGHTFTITKDFFYIDKDGISHCTPAGTTIDGGTIPRFLWRLIGGPFMFAIEAYAIHDGFCDRSVKMPNPESMRSYRLKGDNIFKEILDYLSTYRKNLPAAKRWAMYRGVRIGSQRAVKRVWGEGGHKTLPRHL